MKTLVSYENSVTPLSSFILKVASRCNLDCTYCYEYNMGDHSWRGQPHFANIETLNRVAYRVQEHARQHNLQSVALEGFECRSTLRPRAIEFLLPHGNWAVLPPGRSTDSLSRPYADWLIQIFGAWFVGMHNDISIRTFEEIIEYELGGRGRLE